MAEINLLAASVVQDKLNTEINWLMGALRSAPDGMLSQLQEMLDIRRSTMAAIEAEIARATIAVPAGAEQYFDGV